MGARRVGDFDAREHAGELLDPLFRGEDCETRPTRLTIREFGDPQVVIRLARDLGQMGHAQRLAAASQGRKFTADHFGDGAADVPSSLPAQRALLASLSSRPFKYDAAAEAGVLAGG